MRKKEKVGAIIVAAGKGERMGKIDKPFIELGGRPMLAKVIDTFQECRVIDTIIIVLSRNKLQTGKQMVNENGWTKVKAVCQGGARRQDSVRKGLKKLKNCDWVVIHDGARPLVTSDLIERGLIVARENYAAIAAIPVTDTIKTASPGGFVRTTPMRDRLWTVQTPQAFHFDLISKAHEQITEDVSDDATMVEKLGHEVKIYMGSHENIKITTPVDLALAEIIMGSKWALVLESVMMSTN